MKIRPETFDWLGLLTFPFILGCGISLLVAQSLPVWASWLLVLIGIGGLFIDGGIVYKYFLKKR